MPAVTSSDICVGYASRPEGEGPRARRHGGRGAFPAHPSLHVASLRPARAGRKAIPRRAGRSRGRMRPAGVCHQIAAVEAQRRPLESGHAPDEGAPAHPPPRAVDQGHALHIHFLAAPGLLGHGSSFELASAHPEVVQRGLRLRKLGAELTGSWAGGAQCPSPSASGEPLHSPNRAAIDRALRHLERGEWTRWRALPS